MCAGAAHATGVPGSMDRFLPSYCAVCFGIGTLTSWPASNNAALFAEVSIQNKVLLHIPGVPLPASQRQALCPYCEQFPSQWEFCQMV